MGGQGNSLVTWVEEGVEVQGKEVGVEVQGKEVGVEVQGRSLVTSSARSTWGPQQQPRRE